MGSTTVKIFTSLDNPELASMINDGGVGVIPTDTIYGLVAKIDHPTAVTKMYQLKARELQPGTVIAGSTEQLKAIGFPESHLEKVRHLWPNAVSVVLPADNIADYVKSPRTDLPVRIPNYQQLLNLLAQTGPLMTTSANHPGQPHSTSIDDVVGYFDDKLDFMVNIGEITDRPPSTIIGLDGDEIIVYRQGAVKI